MLEALITYGGAVRGLTYFGLTWLEWIGLTLTVGVLLYQIPLFFHSLYSLWIGPMLGHQLDLRKVGKWAVVTGASDGIGKAYAQELARLGLDIVLVSRSREKLQGVADEIEHTFKVQTKIVVVDFTDGPSVYSKVKEELKGLEIGTLVNNVGMWYPHVEYFMDLPNGDKVCLDLVNCNVLPITMMTRIVLPQMLERKAGAIINIGSLTSVLVAFPCVSAYAATKAYIEKLSQSLAYEYSSQGIVIQTVLPGYVTSKLSGISTPSWTCPSPNDFVKQAIKTVGLQQRTAVHLPHRLAIKAMEWSSLFIPFLTSKAILLAGLEIRRIQLLGHSQEVPNSTENKIELSAPEVIKPTQPKAVKTASSVTTRGPKYLYRRASEELSSTKQLLLNDKNARLISSTLSHHSNCSYG